MKYLIEQNHLLQQVSHKYFNSCHVHIWSCQKSNPDKWLMKKILWVLHDRFSPYSTPYFNFFNPNDRIASAFNLESLRLEALHQLGDWNLSLSYQGRPEQQIKFNSSTGNDESRIVWSPAFSVEVRWVALPALYSSFRIDRRGIDSNGGWRYHL